MRIDFKDLYEGPRFEKRAKNRRFNKLLNISIALVFLLILFFTYNLFFGGKSEPASTEIAGGVSKDESEEMAAVDDENKEETSDEENTEDTIEVVTDETEETSAEDSTSETEVAIESVEEDNETVENTSEDPNVKQTSINKSWKPVGTVQAEPHVAVYDKESVDWKEMSKAIQYATVLTEQDWILWRIGNNGSPQRAKGVVSTKDKKYVYQVYIEWVPNEGWKPTKLEKLNEVPPEYTGKDTNNTTDTEQSSEE